MRRGFCGAEVYWGMKNVIILLVGCLVGMGARGQGAAPEPSEAKVTNEVWARDAAQPKFSRLDTGLERFFIGHWAGKGEFSNGKPIEADVVFRLDLDSSWLVYEHRDRAPNDYRATSMWGVDRSGQFVGYTFDNFHGHRQWMSNGWAEGKLILSGTGVTGAFVLFEHFVYERVSPTQFRMTYEVSRDGIKWILGDWLVFTKVE